jgi:hypothetical protein
VVGVSANDELKGDMHQLTTSLAAVQTGFFTNDKTATIDAITKLKASVAKVLGNKESITALLPDSVKHKASIAINSSDMIQKSADEIIEVLNDRDMRMINKQMKTQKAFANIQSQCFRCHNLVRDWE